MDKVWVVIRDFDNWDDHSTMILGIFTKEELAKDYTERLIKANTDQYTEYYYGGYKLDCEDELF